MISFLIKYKKLTTLKCQVFAIKMAQSKLLITYSIAKTMECQTVQSYRKKFADI